MNRLITLARDLNSVGSHAKTREMYPVTASVLCDASSAITAMHEALEKIASCENHPADMVAIARDVLKKESE